MRGIARQLGLELTLGSRPGRGSVFRLAFSIDESEQADRFEKAVPIGGEIRALKGRILLLEDNRFVRDALKGMLESWGAEVVAEGEPGEGFYRRAAETQDVIALVSDYNLGADKPNGLEAAGMIEAHMKRPVPTVMLTAVAVDQIEGEYRKRREEGRVAPSLLPHILQKPADARSLNESIVRVRPAAENAGA